jgi:hypothetical protein
MSLCIYVPRSDLTKVFAGSRPHGMGDLLVKNYKLQNTNYKQIPNYNVQNYKQFRHVICRLSSLICLLIFSSSYLLSFFLFPLAAGGKNKKEVKSVDECMDKKIHVTAGDPLQKWVQKGIAQSASHRRCRDAIYRVRKRRTYITR